MAHFSDRNQPENPDGESTRDATSDDTLRDAVTGSSTHQTHSTSGKRFTDERINQTLIKHYFNEILTRDIDSRVLFDQALDTILKSFKPLSDVYWTMGEAAQHREQCVPSDRTWREGDSRDFWFMLCDPEEPPVGTGYQQVVMYALRDCPRPNMRGNLAQAHISVAITMIERSAALEIADLTRNGSATEQINAIKYNWGKQIYTIQKAVIVAQGVYDAAFRFSSWARDRLEQPRTPSVDP